MRQHIISRWAAGIGTTCTSAAAWLNWHIYSGPSLARIAIEWGMWALTTVTGLTGLAIWAWNIGQRIEQRNQRPTL